jgi:predicted O-methyltransferase YrrM
MNYHICVILCYNNLEHIVQCFESLKNSFTDFFIIENKSDRSDEIEKYFKNQKILGYIQFERNITFRSTEIFLKDYQNLLEQYEYITITDGDLLINNSEDTFKEIIKNLNLKDVGVSCVDLSLENFPYHVKGSKNWLSPKISENDDYIECDTGIHLTTLKKENLFLFYGKFLDNSIRNRVKEKKIKWVKTKKNKALHLTWDLYYEGNEYFEYKINNYKIWNHDMTSPYTKKITQTEKSLRSLETISKNIDNKTFHHHYFILLDIANSFDVEYELNYLEIGCYAGGSASLMMERKNTRIVSVDIGNPIPIEIAIENVNKHNQHNNFYKYIKDDSRKATTLNKVKEIMDEVDILFIDGDHTYNAVFDDFNLYSSIVKSGGYIVFDDYNDSEFSPEVKLAVNDILKNTQEYEIIGTFDNILGARPKTLTDGNCFLIKKI